MRARRSRAAGLLTAAAFSTTVGGFAITGSLGKAFASPPVSPPVSHPVHPGHPAHPGQVLTLADLDTGMAGTMTGFNFSVTNLWNNAAGALGTETLQTDVALQGTTTDGCSTIPCPLVSGNFTITTSVGRLSGTATGEFMEAQVPGEPVGDTAPEYGVLTLSVTSATGDFKGLTGRLDVPLEFPTLGSLDFQGSVVAI